MKNLISILIVVVVLATLVLTCPDKDSHMDAINNELISVIDSKMNESPDDKGDDKKDFRDRGYASMES